MSELLVGETYMLKSTKPHAGRFRNLGRYLGVIEQRGYFELRDGNFAVAQPAHHLVVGDERKVGLDNLSSGVFFRTENPAQIPLDIRANLNSVISNLNLDARDARRQMAATTQ